MLKLLDALGWCYSALRRLVNRVDSFIQSMLASGLALCDLAIYQLLPAALVPGGPSGAALWVAALGSWLLLALAVLRSHWLHRQGRYGVTGKLAREAAPVSFVTACFLLMTTVVFSRSTLELAANSRFYVPLVGPAWLYFAAMFYLAVRSIWTRSIDKQFVDPLGRKRAG